MGKKANAAKSASKAEAKATKKAKLAAKAERKEVKQAGGSGKKGKGKAKDDVVDEDDLIKTLEEYRQKWADEHKTTEEVADIPSRRANAVLVACPVSTSLYLLGGEYFDGTTCTFYPELYKYNTEKNEWRRLSSPTQPSPRSAHQMVASPSGGGRLWVFGGEYSAPNQTAFHHYRDLWSFNIESREWERFDTKLRPSARSGHRMCLWKHYLVLFAGFHDTGRKTTYLSDLWLWDTQEYRWHEVIMRDVDRRPSARSGFSFLSCPEGIVLHGGYCKEYQGKQVKGVALDDTWLLKMDTDPTKIKWEKRKKIGYAPSVRSGVQMAMWQARGIGVMFGGVIDTYDDEDALTSSFFNDLFGYQTTGTGRWISMNLKKPKKKVSKKVRRTVQQPSSELEIGGNEQGDDNEVEALKNGDNSEHHPDDSSAADFPVEDDNDPNDPQKTVPIARYNAMLAVQRNTLYVYGGIVESQNREFTLDDFYSLALDKLDHYQCLKECNIAELEWKESDSEDDSGSDTGSDSSSDTDEVGESIGQGPDGIVDGEEDEIAEAVPVRDPDLRAQAIRFTGVAKNATMSAEELLSTPLPGETVKTFYDRTRDYWTAKAHSTSDNRGKELRRDGFSLASERYEVYKPILEEIERIQAEAGLDDDDVVSAQRVKASGTGADSRHRR